MSNIIVNKNSLLAHSSEMQDIESRLGQVQSEVLSVRSAISVHMSSSGMIKSHLRDLASQIGDHKNKVSNMSRIADSIANTYFRVESDIRGQYEARKGSSGTIRGFSSGGGGGGGSSSGGGRGGSNDRVVKDSLISGNADLLLTLFGSDFEAKVKGDLLSYKYDSSSYAKWDLSKGEIKAEWKESLSGHLAKCEIESKWGIFSNKAEVTAVKGEASSALYLGLMEDGKFNPKIGGEAKVSGSLLEGKASTQVGTEEFNYHAKAKGNLVGAEAKAGVGIGNLGQDKYGRTKYGVKANVGADAYLAKGDVTGGFTLFGIDIDLTMSGKAGAIGAKAGMEAYHTGVSINGGLSALLGIEGTLKIDWSDFKLPKFKWPDFKLW